MTFSVLRNRFYDDKDPDSSQRLNLFRLVKITVFYIAYFAFLAGLFTASIQLMQSQLPQEDGQFKKPKLNTRLNIPGLNYFPKFGADVPKQKERLANNDGIAFYWQDGKKDGDNGYQYYVDQTNAVFESYANTADCPGCKVSPSFEIKPMKNFLFRTSTPHPLVTAPTPRPPGMPASHASTSA